MARLLVVLVCGVLVFMLVWRVAPRFIETYATSGNPEEVAPAETADNKGATKSKSKGTAQQKAKSVGGSASASRPDSTTPMIAGDLSAPPSLSSLSSSAMTPVPTGPSGSRPKAQVTAENATIYLTNTSGGPVVGRLAKGAVVEPVFVVSSAGQNWTFVSASNEEITGFMRSDSLSKSKSAEPARR